MNESLPLLARIIQATTFCPANLLKLVDQNCSQRLFISLKQTEKSASWWRSKNMHKKTLSNGFLGDNNMIEATCQYVHSMIRIEITKVFPFTPYDEWSHRFHQSHALAESSSSLFALRYLHRKTVNRIQGKWDHARGSSLFRPTFHRVQGLAAIRDLDFHPIQIWSIERESFFNCSKSFLWRHCTPSEI